jgi:hypothetical protein
MPVAMTFSSLQQDMQSYLERGTVQDPLVFAQLPELINFAERRISTELKVLGFVVPATITLQANVAVYQKPDRWRKTVSWNVGQSASGTAVRSQMFPRSYEYIRSYWPDDTQTNLSVYGVAAPPKFYADYNYQNFIFAPTPDAAYPAEIVYYEQPALLDATNQTNFITQYLPNLLLYASLLECTPFLKKDDRIPVWKDYYDRFAGVYNQQSSDEIIDRSTTRKET